MNSLGICMISACLVSLCLARPQLGLQEQQQQLFFFPQRPDNGFPFISTTSRTPTTTTSSAGDVTTPSARYYACLQTCPSTMEYNPVCGSDSQNYHNEWRLQCAQRCGQNVSLVRMGICG